MLRPAGRRRPAEEAELLRRFNRRQAAQLRANFEIRLLRMRRVLIGVVTCGAVIIVGISFASSYAASASWPSNGVWEFSYVFPVGINAGICVLLANLPLA